MAKKTKRRTKVAKVQVLAKIETAAARRGEELIDLIGRRISGIAEAFYDIGLALHELLHKKLYGALGYRSFNELLGARKLMRRTQAAKLIEVATSMTRDQAIRLGFERAFATARLVAATPEPDTVASVLTSGVKTGEGGHGRRKVEQMSVREIESVARDARQKVTGKSDAEKSADSTARATRTALVKAGLHVLECKAVRRSKVWVVRAEVKPASS